MSKIMFSAGEVSGDMHGARLAEAIRRREPQAELIGFGGRNMEQSGVRLLADISDYSVMGVAEVVFSLRKLWQLRDFLTEAMKKEKPDLLVLIDYPDFNWRLAERAKKLGIPVFSYIPPSAWAWRKGRAKSCAELAEEFVAIFPFETKVYEEAGANISFLGNPLVDTVKASMPEAEAGRFFGIREDMYPVLLLPGSRRQEIELLFPIMLRAAKLIKKEKPETEFFLPVAQGIKKERLEELIAASGVKVTMTAEHTYDLMRLCRYALAASGTVVMEAAIMELPCIVLYRFNILSYIIGKILIGHIDHFSLPNILAGEGILPELLQGEVTPERILSEARRYFADEAHGEDIRRRLRATVALLGEPDASGRIAERILAAAARHRKSAGEEI